SYANTGATNYPTAFGGDGINHFPGGGANYDALGGASAFAFAGKLTTDTTDPDAIRFGTVVGTFADNPAREDWFSVGSGTTQQVPDGGRHLYLAVLDTFAGNNFGSYAGEITAVSDVALLSASLQTPTPVQFTYQVIGLPGPFAVGLYRSADGVNYAPADLLVAQTVNPGTTNPQTGTFTFPSPLTADASKPYLLVVADPDHLLDELDENNNSQSFLLPDDAPVLNPIGDRSVNEGSLLTFTATATDPNPGDVLTFSLDPSAPAGAAIDPVSGVFTWTPDDGPAARTVTVRVRDSGNPALDDAETITLTVVNVAPTAMFGNGGAVNEGS